MFVEQVVALPRSRRGRWSEALCRFDHFLAEFARCASNADPRYDPIYASAYAIRDVLQVQALRESGMV